jgi:hypothetical protein
VQHCDGDEHVAPSGLHWLMHVPCAQTPLQHSEKFMQPDPFGWQGGWQTPPTQLPEQQFGPLAHMPPSCVHIIPQFAPHMFVASWTQMLSHAVWQQNGSCWQTVAAQGLHPGFCGPSCWQTSWHIPTVEQKKPVPLFWHCSPAQQSPGVMHGAPGGWHLPMPQSPLGPQTPVQHWFGPMQGVPSG